MLVPTCCHRCWKVAVDPVKWMPANRGSDSATSETANPSPVNRLITPGGKPAASSSFIVRYADRVWVMDGFHTTVLPISAGAVGRLPAIAGKLNGVIEETN